MSHTLFCTNFSLAVKIPFAGINGREKIENEYNILKINIDENRDFAIDKGIEVVPTIFIYRNGKKAKELEGYKTAEELKQEIQNI